MLHHLKKTVSHDRIFVPVLVLLCGFLFFFNLGGLSLIETDEFIYTHIAREILSTGDFLTLHLKGQNWFMHPPLFMWISAFFIYFLGLSEFSARIASAFFGLGGVLAVYYLGKNMFSKRDGFIAAIVLASSLQYIVQSRIALFDGALVCFMTLSILFFWLGYKRQQSNFYLLSSLCMGLGTLTKGPVAALLPLLIIVPFILLQGTWRQVLKDAQLRLSIPIYIAVGWWWYLLSFLLHGQVFFNEVIIHYHVFRYFGVIDHTGPWYYYFVVVAAGFLPWIIFLIPALFFLFQKKFRAEEQFLLLGIVITFVFFSLAQTKLPGYILGLYPFLALGVGKFINDRINNLWMRYFFVSLVLFMCLLIAFLMIYVAPQVDDARPYKSLSLRANELVHSDDFVGGYQLYQLGFDYYVIHPIVWFETPAKAAESLANTNQRIFILVPKSEFENFASHFSYLFYVLDEKAGVLIISNQL